MIEWQRVSELHEEVGSEDFAEVVEIFLEEVEEVVLRLRKAAGAPVEDDLHFLKGSALNLGFSQLASLCDAGEKAARDGKRDIDLAAVCDSFEASRTEFLAGTVARKFAA